MKIIIGLIIVLISLSSHGFPIPKNNKAVFDIMRKNKVIGSAETSFINQEDILIVKTTLDIEVKVLFISAYKFFQTSEERWVNDNFIAIDGYTDFEDDREYFIKGQDIDNHFSASGMDGEILLDINILPLNYWNKKILSEKVIFDTQKGIVRNITVKSLGEEIVKVKNNKILSEKYTLDASSNPKDIGPFPQYTLWYDKNDELIKFKFKNWKDKKDIVFLRNYEIRN